MTSVDLKKMAKALQMNEPRGTKLGWIYQALAAGFGFKTWAALTRRRTTPFELDKSEFNIDAYKARLNNIRRKNGYYADKTARMAVTQ